MRWISKNRVIYPILLKTFFSRFFGFFGGVDDASMWPVNTDFASSNSSFMDILCDMFGFFIPEGGGGGAYYCSDPSKMMPPSPFLTDFGDFCSDS